MCERWRDRPLPADKAAYWQRNEPRDIRSCSFEADVAFLLASSTPLQLTFC